MNKCHFSEDRKYRYMLSHTWETSLPTATFIGLNPSTADESQLDPTLRRIMGFADSWGYGSFDMLNLFAFRATNPKDMMSADDPVGHDNNLYLEAICKMTKGVVIACWGNHGSYKNRANEVLEFVQNTSYLKMTKAGQPSHPLYLKKTLKPIKMETKDGSIMHHHK